jgi:two-component system nitrate/nitrite response regulator NarL
MTEDLPMPEPDRTARILLVDDHVLFRESVARFLDSEPGFEVVGGCGNVEEARHLLQEKDIDLVLLDFDLGQHDGLDFIRMIERLHFKGKVLLVTASIGDADAASLIRHGIAGIIPKHNSPALLAEAIRDVLSGRAWFEPDHLYKIMARAGSINEKRQTPTDKLTNRERQVLLFVFDGLTNRDIADQLQVSESTIKVALHQLFLKTGASTRGQLVRIALERYKDQL